MVVFVIFAVYLCLLIFSGLFLVASVIFIFSEFWGKQWAYTVPFVPTSSADVARAVALVPITKADVVYDIGCGDGRILFAAERAGAGTCMGFEIAPWPYVVARVRAFFTGSRVVFVRSDFFHVSFADATLIYSYLLPHVVARAQEKILRECKKGTVVVSRDYPYTQLSEVQRVVAGKHTLFVYRVQPSADSLQVM